MSNDPLDQLDEAPTPEVEAPQAAETDVSHLDEASPIDDGRAPSIEELATPAEIPAEVQAPPPVDPATPPAEQSPIPNAVPLPALLDERERRQDAMRRAEYAEQQLTQFQRLQQQQPAQQIDPLMDPEAFAESIMQRVDQQRQQERQQDKADAENHRFNSSEATARQFDKDGRLDAAFNAWNMECQHNPALRQQIISSPHPWGEVQKWHDQKQVLDLVGDDPAAYEQRVRDKLLRDMGLDPATVPNNGAPAIPQAPASSPQATPAAALAPAAVPAPPRALPASLANAGAGATGGVAPAFDADADPLEGLA